MHSMFGASPPPFPCHYLLAWLIDKSFVSHSKAEHIESIPHKAKKKHLSGVNFLAQRNSCIKTDEQDYSEQLMRLGYFFLLLNLIWLYSRMSYDKIKPVTGIKTKQLIGTVWKNCIL